MTTPHHARHRQTGPLARPLPNAMADGDWPAWFDAYLGAAVAPLLAVGLEHGIPSPAGARDAGSDGERR